MEADYNKSETVADSLTSRPNISMSGVDSAFVIISNVTALASIAGSMLICSMYLVYKEIRTTCRLLLVFLCIADFFVNVSTLWQTSTYYKSLSFPRENTFLCQTAAGILVYSQICTSLWTVAISFYLFLCISGRCLKIANRIVFFFHIFCWLMPLVVSMSADLAGVYGYDFSVVKQFSHPTSCWISGKVGNPLPWYFLTVEGWVIAAFTIISLLHLAINWTIYCKKTKGKEIPGDDVIEGLAIQKANEQLRFIPVIYVFTRIWGTMYFFFTRYPYNRHLRASDWLMIIKAIGDNSQGIMNAIFFCFATKQMQNIVVKNLRTCCRCLCSWYLKNKVRGREKWMRVQSIVRVKARMPKKSRNLDGSDLDLSGISLDLPSPDGDPTEDEVIFEQ